MGTTHGIDRQDGRARARRLGLACGAVAALGLLAGCSDVRQAVGLEKDPPDEFAVMVRKPLSMPADFGLPAPQPGADRPQVADTRDKARQIVLDATGKDKQDQQAAVKPIEGVQPDVAALLHKLGADKVDPDIRQVVDRETTELALQDQSFVDKLIFWRVPPPPGTVVDPAKERRRIQENVALGRPVDAGKTPTIARKSKSIFQGLF